jgi:hypothetical protein
MMYAAIRTYANLCSISARTMANALHIGGRASVDRLARSISQIHGAQLGKRSFVCGARLCIVSDIVVYTSE